MLKIILIPIAIIALVLAGCSEGEKSTAEGSASFLVQNFEGLDLNRISETRTFKGNSLWEYINGGAELYHMYNFVEVSTADYKSKITELAVDIYQFDTPENAFGLYSQLRLPENDLISLGVEGFISPGSLNFIKGDYLIRVTGYDDDGDGGEMMINVAEKLNHAITGTDKMPELLSKLPSENIINGSHKYVAKSFLGHQFLNNVYSADYGNMESEWTVFICQDTTGKMFIDWRDYAEQSDQMADLPKSIAVDNNYGFLFKDKFYGDIVVGLKSGYLVGVIEYKKGQKNMLNSWLNSI